MKEKLSKFFKVTRTIVTILAIIGLIISSFFNIAMHQILKTEEIDNNEFFELKVAIAQCYLDGKNGLLGSNEGLYKDVLYSSNSQSNINIAKWIASGIEIGGEWANYEAEMKLPFKKKMGLRLNDDDLKLIVDNQEHNSRDLVMGGQPIKLAMYYDRAENLFIVEVYYE